MPTFSSTQIPPPINWQDFETLCCDLWRSIWADPNTLKNGREGQPQHGVDIYGRPNQGSDWAGIQCKGKDNYAKKRLSKSEVITEVEKAKSFEPKLSQFIIATSGLKDVKVEELARRITDEHHRNKIFTVHIWGWEEIVNRCADFNNIIEKHYPEFSFNTKGLKKDTDEIKETTKAILESNLEIKSKISTLSSTIETSDLINRPDTSLTVLTTEYQAELDHSRDLLKDYKSVEALKFLEKLKKRIWSNSPSIVKYRILTNIGSAKLSMNQYQEAGKLFIEALQYNPEDEKALLNTSLGFLLLSEFGEAKTYVNKVLEKNPINSRAYSIIIQIPSDNENLEEIITKVPEPLRASPEVAYAIGNLLRKRKNLPEAKKFLEIAIANDTEDLPELKADLGEVLLELVLEPQMTLLGIQLNEEQRQHVQDSIQLFSSAWNQLANSDLRNYRLNWILNRGLSKRLLGDIDGAGKDIKVAYETDSSNPIFIKYNALIEHDNGNNERAIELLKSILSAHETPESLILLIDLLRNENKFSEAISIINERLESISNKLIKQEAERLLIQLYIDNNDIENAKKKSNSMRAIDPTNVFYLVDAAKVEIALGKSDNAISLLNEAKKYITNDSSVREMLDLAEEYYSLKQFENAAWIYEKFVDKTIDTPLTKKLVTSYYNAGEMGIAFEICKALREKFGPLKYFLEMESAINEEIGNLPEAKRICNEYLNSFPNDFEINLRLAVVNFRSKSFEELDQFLGSSINIEEISLEAGIQLAYLYAERGIEKKAYSTMYEIRRRYFNNAEAHLKYIGFFLMREKKYDDELLNITKVCVDTAVCVREDSEKSDWYIIEDRKDANIQYKEINLKHPLTQKLMGKSVKEKILLRESPYSKEFAEIVEIKSKFIYALHESSDMYEKLFPETTGFWKIKVDMNKKERGLPKSFQTILDEQSRDNEKIKNIEQLYKQNKITIGQFTILVGRNVIDVIGGLTNKPDLGIKCCFGNTDERNYAVELLSSNPKLIIDIIALMTLQGLNAEDIIIKSFGKFGISQSTIDIIDQVISERKGLQSRGFMNVWKEGEKYFRQEISSDDIEHNCEFLEGIMTWIDGNCDILPCKRAIEVKRELKKHLDKVLGVSFMDTSLIASEPGNILYTDDRQLRFEVKKHFNINGIWTQALLMHCKNNNKLEKDIYDKLIIKLVCSHYYHTSIDAGILIEAARQSKWAPMQPFTDVINVLRGKSSDEKSALIVGTQFLFELWKQPVLPDQRDYLILALLNSLTAERNHRIILEKLIFNINERFFLLPLAKRQIMLLIDIWKHMHII